MHDDDEQGRPVDCSYSCHICHDTGMTPGSDSCDCRCPLADKRASLNKFIAAMGNLPVGEIAWRAVRVAERTCNALAAADRALAIDGRLKAERERQLAEARAFELSSQMAGKDQRIADLEAQVSALKAAGGVPEGWKLVPVMPTHAMWAAANQADDKAYVGGSQHGADISTLWDAMLDAAPAAPQAAEQTKQQEPK